MLSLDQWRKLLSGHSPFHWMLSLHLTWNRRMHSSHRRKASPRKNLQRKWERTLISNCKSKGSWNVSVISVGCCNCTSFVHVLWQSIRSIGEMTIRWSFNRTQREEIALRRVDTHHCRSLKSSILPLFAVPCSLVILVFFARFQPVFHSHHSLLLIFITCPSTIVLHAVSIFFPPVSAATWSDSLAVLVPEQKSNGFNIGQVSLCDQCLLRTSTEFILPGMHLNAIIFAASNGVSWHASVITPSSIGKFVTID